MIFLHLGQMIQSQPEIFNMESSQEILQQQNRYQASSQTEVREITIITREISTMSKSIEIMGQDYTHEILEEESSRKLNKHFFIYN